MNKQDRVMEIFLVECREILEEVAPKLLDLEDSPDDKEIINDIFRGIHTLKGNANSFGFTKLGGFVHYFEDLLSIYRKEDAHLEKNIVDLFIRAFDIVEQVFSYEEQGREDYPEYYNEILDEIKNALSYTQTDAKEVKILDEIVTSSTYEHNEKIDVDALVEMLKHTEFDYKNEDFSDKKIFKVDMNLDNDIYLRGYNHQIFFRLLKDLGDILYSTYTVDANVPTLDSFDTELSYIKQVSIYLLTQVDTIEIEDVFEFIAEEHEVNITEITLENIKGIMQNRVQEVKEVQETKKEAEVANDSNLKAYTPEKAKSSIRVESSKLDELFDSIGELVIAQSYISQNEEIRSINNQELNQYLDMLGKSTRIIQNKVMGLRMMPIRDTFLKMKRVVRDVSQKTSKDIELILSGEETEVDKTMVDKLSEPLIHLLRNSVDHGIESNVQTRVEAGKEANGKIWLEASHRGSSFVIEIKDDGRGIDKDVILKKAIEKGIAKEGMTYTDEEIIHFIFAAGFSTASSITDVSGRGVGLDAVKRSIDELKGKIVVETKLGVGTTFKIILPLTLAIIDGLTVRLANETLIVPTLSVVESFSPVLSDIKNVKSRGEFIDFRGEILPIVRLNKLLNLNDEMIPFEDSTLICVDHERGRFILQVNELLGRQQVVIKSLGILASNSKEISGVAILGTGNIALILNVEGIRDYLDAEVSS
nr:chemotaxis protein CheA [uncultured Sulfurimonas sp.]